MSILKKSLKVLKVSMLSLLALIFVAISTFLIIEFPICKIKAKIKFNEFISTAQHVDKDDIKEIQYSKDYKLGGYVIKVEYKCDPGYTYYYTYREDGRMSLEVVDPSSNVHYGGGLKYPVVMGYW